MSRPSALAAALLLIGRSISLQAAPAPLQIDDFFHLKEVGSPRISPSGELVAMTVTTVDLDKDTSETALWMVETSKSAGAVPWRLTAPGDSASQPRWSPDGQKLAFLSARKSGTHDGKTQVWAFDLRGGDAQPLTKIAQGVEAFEWSPDGTRLLLQIKDPKPEDLLDETERKPIEPKPHVIDRLQFKRDFVGYLDRRRTHLYVLDVSTEGETGKLVQLTSGDYDDSGGSWSPDGKLVAFSSNRTADPDGNTNSDLWIVSADNSDQGQTMRRLTTNPGSDRAPSWSPDSKFLTYLTVTQPELMWYATEHLAIISTETHESKPRILTKDLDRHVSSPRFTPDGQSINFLVEDSGAQHLARVDINSGRISPVVEGRRRISSFSLDDAGSVALLASESIQPNETYLLDPAGLVQLTHFNRSTLERIALGEVTEIRYESFDGTEIEAFVTYPPDYDERLKYPTILNPHGGPVAQYDFGFDFESHLYAANGYLVLRPNPRGSSGYGQAFSAAIFADWGNLDTRDILAGIDFLIDSGAADADRLGVGGWSYGGMLTNYVITRTDRFKAAISGASEVLYIANYGHDHYQRAWEAELGLPWENRELWERLSPFNQVDRITTPTLVMCGALDWNVPVQNSEQLYQALKRLGRTTELVVYPGEHHQIRRPSFQKDQFERFLDWFDRHVKGTPSAAEEQPAAVKAEPSS